MANILKNVIKNYIDDISPLIVPGIEWYNDVKDLTESRDTFNRQKALNGMYNWTAEDILREMYVDNVLDEKEYKQGLQAIKNIEQATGQTLTYDNNFWTIMGTSFGLLGNKDQKQAVELYKKMAAYAPTIASNIATDPNTMRNAILGSAPVIEDAPGYTPFSEEFNPDKIDVDDLHLWTNQEIADLHNVNYDPNYYYDLVKNATEGKVQLAESQIAQADTAAGLQDEMNRAAYLDTIRNTKSDAVEKGASAGARAASELLNNVSSLQTYAGNRAGVATNNQSIIETPLRNAANYKSTANEYFDSLAQSLMGTGSSYYASDVQKRGQQMLTNADMYQAAANELNARIQANANMYAAQAQANASIGLARANANSYRNDLLRMYDVILAADNNNAKNAYNDFTNIITAQYHDKQPVMDWLIGGSK